jgi:hypothetical protein
MCARRGEPVFSIFRFNDVAAEFSQAGRQAGPHDRVIIG